jgi:hypothetical protein
LFFHCSKLLFYKIYECRGRPFGLPATVLFAGRQSVLELLGDAAETVEVDADDLALHAGHGRRLFAGLVVFFESDRAESFRRAVFIDRTDLDECAVAAVDLVDLDRQRIRIERRTGLKTSICAGEQIAFLRFADEQNAGTGAEAIVFRKRLHDRQKLVVDVRNKAALFLVGAVFELFFAFRVERFEGFFDARQIVRFAFGAGRGLIEARNQSETQYNGQSQSEN